MIPNRLLPLMIYLTFFLSLIPSSVSSSVFLDKSELTCNIQKAQSITLSPTLIDDFRIAIRSPLANVVIEADYELPKNSVKLLCDEEFDYIVKDNSFEIQHLPFVNVLTIKINCDVDQIAINTKKLNLSIQSIHLNELIINSKIGIFDIKNSNIKKLRLNVNVSSYYPDYSSIENCFIYDSKINIDYTHKLYYNYNVGYNFDIKISSGWVLLKKNEYTSSNLEQINGKTYICTTDEGFQGNFQSKDIICPLNALFVNTLIYYKSGKYRYDCVNHNGQIEIE